MSIYFMSFHVVKKGASVDGLIERERVKLNQATNIADSSPLLSFLPSSLDGRHDDGTEKGGRASVGTKF